MGSLVCWFFLIRWCSCSRGGGPWWEKLKTVLLSACSVPAGSAVGLGASPAGLATTSTGGTGVHHLQHGFRLWLSHGQPPVLLYLRPVVGVLVTAASLCGTIGASSGCCSATLRSTTLSGVARLGLPSVRNFRGPGPVAENKKPPPSRGGGGLVLPESLVIWSDLRPSYFPGCACRIAYAARLRFRTWSGALWPGWGSSRTCLTAWLLGCLGYPASEFPLVFFPFRGLACCELVFLALFGRLFDSGVGDLLGRSGFGGLTFLGLPSCLLSPGLSRVGVDGACCGGHIKPRICWVAGW